MSTSERTQCKYHSLRRGDAQGKREGRFELVLPIVCLLLFTQLTGLQFTQFNSALRVQRILLVVAFVLLVIAQMYLSVHERTIKYDMIFALLILLCAIYAAFTLLNDGSLSEFVQKIIYLVGPWMFIAVFGVANPHRMLRACYYAFFLMAIMNTIGVIATYNEGGFAPNLGTYWLFGQRTYMRNVVFPALFFSVFNDRMRGRALSFPTLVLMVQNPLVLYAVDSMTSCMLAVVIDVVLIMMLCGIEFNRIAIPFAVSNILFSLIVVLLRQVSFISGFVTSVLHRDLTFSGRVTIWDLVFEKIRSSPWLGTGFRNIDDNGLEISATKNVSNAHNELLDVAYKGGLAALIVFVALVVRCCMPLFKKNSSWAACIIGLFVGAYFIEAAVSDIWYPQFFLLLFMAAYIDLWEGVLSARKVEPIRFDRRSQKKGSRSRRAKTLRCRVY